MLFLAEALDSNVLNSCNIYNIYLFIYFPFDH
uniref:Uncharacterized protein n=1 Tax=Arundo donax TaxID=35708 RepID=A0A0A9BN18_ARUDO